MEDGAGISARLPRLDLLPPPIMGLTRPPPPVETSVRGLARPLSKDAGGEEDGAGGGRPRTPAAALLAGDTMAPEEHVCARRDSPHYHDL